MTMRLLIGLLALGSAVTADSAIDPMAQCQAGKAKATGKRVFQEMKCHQKAFLTGTVVDPGCLARAETQFFKAVAKADAAGSCPGMEADLNADVEACVGTLATSVGSCSLSLDGKTITCGGGGTLDTCNRSTGSDGLTTITCSGRSATLDYGYGGVLGQLTELQGRLVEYHQTHGSFPVATAAATPMATCCAAGGVHDCPANAAAWNGVLAWDLLGFQITAEHNHVFAYTGTTGHHATVIASGDVYCTGVTFDFDLECDDTSGVPVCTLNLPALQNDGSCSASAGLMCSGLRATFNESCTFSHGTFWTTITCGDGGTGINIDPGLEQAVHELFDIQSGQWSFLHSHFNYVVQTAAATPAPTCCAAGGVFECPANPAAWSGVPAWDQLGFSIATPHTCVLSYTGTTGVDAQAIAECDLDCDGQVVDITMNCTQVGTADSSIIPSCYLSFPARAD